MARTKKASVRTISQLCGVSTATVSRVLNNDPHVSEKTKQLVLNAAQECGYNLDASMINKKLNARKKIGIITPSIGQEYYNSLSKRITEYMEPFGYDVLFTSFIRKYEKLPEMLNTLYRCKVDGVIFISCGYLEVKDYLDSNIPHVWIDCNDPIDICSDIYTIQSDHFAGGQLAAIELLNKGCKSPLVLTSSSDSIRSQQRCLGFIQEFEKAGITLNKEERIKYLPLIKNVFDESQELVRYLIAKEYPFDSVFAISDWRALGVYSAAESMNRKVPGDIKIIGFDGISLACRSVLRITSIQQNIKLLSQSAGDTLMKLISGKIPENKHTIIPVDIMVGQTT